MQTEENALEKALRKAADEPADRPEFYRILLESKVLVIGSSDKDCAGALTLEANSTVSLQNWQRPDGSPVIPFFSSLQVLERSIEREESYLILPVRPFFEMTRGSSLVLNPRSDYGKEFFPNELEAILSVKMNKRVIPRIVDKETRAVGCGDDRNRIVRD